MNNRTNIIPTAGHADADRMLSVPGAVLPVILRWTFTGLISRAGMSLSEGATL